jgi:hypothetical protein
MRPRSASTQRYKRGGMPINAVIPATTSGAPRLAAIVREPGLQGVGRHPKGDLLLLYVLPADHATRFGALIVGPRSFPWSPLSGAGGMR